MITMTCSVVDSRGRKLCIDVDIDPGGTHVQPLGLRMQIAIKQLLDGLVESNEKPIIHMGN
jgi:hypothetical protein